MRYPFFVQFVDASVDPNTVFENQGNEVNPLMLMGPNPYPRNMPPGRKYTPPPQSSLIICFGCGGNHYVRDCPDRKLATVPQNPKFPPVERYCLGCCDEHLPKDCLLRPVEITSTKPKASLNYVEVVPSPTTSEIKIDVVPLRVITRSQVQKKLTRRQKVLKRVFNLLRVNVKEGK